MNSSITITFESCDCVCAENLLIKNNDSKIITIKIATNISNDIILYSTIGNKITIDKKDAKVPDGINLIYPAKDKDTKKLANFIICYMNY